MKLNTSTKKFLISFSAILVSIIFILVVSLIMSVVGKNFSKNVTDILDITPVISITNILIGYFVIKINYRKTLLRILCFIGLTQIIFVAAIPTIVLSIYLQNAPVKEILVFSLILMFIYYLSYAFGMGLYFINNIKVPAKTSKVE